MTQSSELSSLTEIESRVCSSLERFRDEAEGRLRSLSKMVVDKPVRSLGVAFLSGFIIARLLQKLG